MADVQLACHGLYLEGEYPLLASKSKRSTAEPVGAHSHTPLSGWGATYSWHDMSCSLYYLMTWDIEVTDEFRDWYRSLVEEERDSIAVTVDMLEAAGPALGFPHSSQIHGSRHGRMRELRVQHAGRPYRVLYAFDPRRAAILLLGGDKTGDDRWYERMVPRADRLYDDYIATLQGEGLL